MSEQAGKEETKLSDQQKHMLSRLDMLLPAVEDIHITLERKLQFNFGFMTSIATVLIVGNVSWFDHSTLEANEVGSLAVFVLCFLVTAGCALWAYWPRERLITPITPEWDNLKRWWEYPPDEYAEQALLSYKTIWKDDQKVRRCKARVTTISHCAVVGGLLAAFYEGATSLGVIAQIFG